MRISDWSSDVCSSDLTLIADELHHILDHHSLRKLLELRRVFLLNLLLGLLQLSLHRGGLIFVLRRAVLDPLGKLLHFLASGLFKVLDRLIDLSAGRDRKSTRLNSSH